jgi:hypothetical protein
MDQQLDDFGQKIVDEYIDGKTKMGPWATMTPASWTKYGIGKFGVGKGQKFWLICGVWKKVKG